MKQGAHGGDIYKAAKYLGCNIDDIFDYSSNISPWAVSVDVDTKCLSRLPEPHSESLAKAFSEKYGHRTENVCIASGTTEIIEAVCRIYSGNSAKIFHPTYSDYSSYCNKYGIEITGSLLAGLCFICNPNNPTGATIERDVLLTTISKNIGTLFVVDESYMPFHLSEEVFSLTNELADNLIVLRSFSKIYGLPGLRLGGGISGNSELIDKIKELISPWSVNSYAQQAGLRLLGANTKEPAERLQRVKSDFLKELADIDYLEPIDSDVNFILCKLSRGSSSELFDHCLKERVLIRDCSNFEGLDDKFVRFAMTDNVKPLIKALKGF